MASEADTADLSSINRVAVGFEGNLASFYGEGFKNITSQKELLSFLGHEAVEEGGQDQAVAWSCSRQRAYMLPVRGLCPLPMCSPGRCSYACTKQALSDRVRKEGASERMNE